MTFAGLGLQMLLAGRVLTAEEAQRNRLVSQVTPEGQAMSAAMTAANTMVSKFGSADAFKKRLVWRLSGVPLPQAMATVREPVLATMPG
jgi:enoyl-CoA hydratase/carnithine racemase